jgi:hypothetical protein
MDVYVSFMKRVRCFVKFQLKLEYFDIFYESLAISNFTIIRYVSL